MDDSYRFPTHNELFKERFSRTFEDLRCNSLKDAVSDDEGGVGGEDVIYGDVDRWEKDEDAKILSKVKFKGKRKEDEGNSEVFALSGSHFYINKVAVCLFVQNIFLYNCHDYPSLSSNFDHQRENNQLNHLLLCHDYPYLSSIF